MNFSELVLEALDDFSNLDIKVKIHPSITKIWKEVADVWINGEKKGFFGTNDEFKNLQCTGYSLGFDIPGVGNDTLDPKRQALLRHLLLLIRDEYNKHRYMKHGASEEEAVTISKI